MPNDFACNGEEMVVLPCILRAVSTFEHMRGIDCRTDGRTNHLKHAISPLQVLHRRQRKPFRTFRQVGRGSFWRQKGASESHHEGYQRASQSSDSFQVFLCREIHNRFDSWKVFHYTLCRVLLYQEVEGDFCQNFRFVLSNHHQWLESICNCDDVQTIITGLFVR